MSQQPLFSIVVPSFNQGTFLPETLESLLAQAVSCEIIVMDGGSSDASVDVIRSFGDHIAYWHSSPDGGQAEALNSGFARARGQILMWLNADDWLLPGALRHVHERLAEALSADRAAILSGSCLIWRDGECPRAHVQPAARRDVSDLTTEDFLVQPSTAWTRQVWEAAGPLNEALRYTLDWEWFLRAARVAEVQWTSRVLSAYRYHPDHKTSDAGDRRVDEVVDLVRQHAPADWVSAYEAAQRLLRTNAGATRLSRQTLARRWLLQCLRGDRAILVRPGQLRVALRSLAPTTWHDL